VALTREQRARERVARSGGFRDQFKQGYLNGYRRGRDDERHGAFDLLDPDPGPEHVQVDVDGIEVDEGIRDLLVAIWAEGLVTQFSCQGDADRFAPRQGYRHLYVAQVVFSTIDDAVRFVTDCAAMIGERNFSEGGLTLTTMAPWKDDRPRAEVTFSPLLIDELAIKWRERRDLRTAKPAFE
jgi:hypothetical protein